jgi:hypothetical protein
MSMILCLLKHKILYIAIRKKLFFQIIYKKLKMKCNDKNFQKISNHQQGYRMMKIFLIHLHIKIKNRIKK